MGGIDWFITKFPFLIGRIRTSLISNVREKVIKFPFLIGRIRTWKQYI